jgi:MFS-type transporter involved in bile tolerance (Atg22 family)
VYRPSHHDNKAAFRVTSNSSSLYEEVSMMETSCLDPDHDVRRNTSKMGAVLEPQRSEHVFNLEFQQLDGERRPLFFRYIPSMLRFDHAPTEATGLGMDMFARITVFAASVFLGPALLELATNEAGEQCVGSSGDNEAYVACLKGARIHGFLPSSLLSNIATVAGLASLVVLPLFGAIVDHTPHRRAVGVASAYGLVFIKMVEVAISSSTWLAVACLQVMSSILYNLHIVVAYAYSSELSNQPHQQSLFQSHFFLVMFVSMALYMIEVLLLGEYFGNGDVGTARISVVATCVTATPLFFVCWNYLFRDRPALAQVPPGQTLLTAGFARLLQTSRTIQADLPPVQWFLRSLVFSEAANGAFGTVGTTYMSEFLGMSSLEIGQALLVLLLSGIPGAWLGHQITQWYNPVVSAQVSLVVYTVTTMCASLLLSPQDKNKIFWYAVMWGICQGWCKFCD